MKFEPVRTLVDLETIDSDETMDGYRSAERGATRNQALIEVDRSGMASGIE
jgi:hypothetical protein